MPEGVLMTEIEIITDGDRRLHWSCGQSPDRERDTGSARQHFCRRRRNGVAPTFCAGACSKGECLGGRGR